MCIYRCSGLEPYIEYLTKGTLPDDRYKANKLKKMGIPLVFLIVKLGICPKISLSFIESVDFPVGSKERE